MFALYHDDMPGIDPRITFSRLNVNPNFRLVKQKGRAMAPKRLEVVDDLSTSCQFHVQTFDRESMEIYVDDLLVKSMQEVHHI